MSFFEDNPDPEVPFYIKAMVITCMALHVAAIVLSPMITHYKMKDDKRIEQSIMNLEKKIDKILDERRDTCCYPAQNDPYILP